MIRIYQVKCDQEKDLEKALLKKIKCKPSQLRHYEIVRRSVDARKGRVQYSFIVDVDTTKPLKPGPDCQPTPNENYVFPKVGTKTMAHRPLVVGYGPAGLFAGLILAQAGYQPIIIERGQAVLERQDSVHAFWQGGPLNPESNVQFGEGGAGTFSDGKLTTRSKDPRVKKVLDELVKHGAHPDILIDQHPHVGTDAFVPILMKLRQSIQQLGGQILFNTRLEDIRVEQGQLRAAYYQGQWHEHEALVLATGHSARDIYDMMAKHQVVMHPKPFAVGVRIEHPQTFINQAMLHEQATNPALIPARYQVTYQSSLKTGVYSFCMCPGGLVINASSHPEQMVVNGMSYAARDNQLANAALLVQVNEQDYGTDPLGYQEQLERRCFKLAGGFYAASQSASDYLARRVTQQFEIEPSLPYRSVDLNQLFDERVNTALHEALVDFERRIPGFVSSGAVLSGVESRSSSAVVIERNQAGFANIFGLLPCGEGAGYAGGIMTSAIDGIRCAEAIIRTFDKPSVQ